MSASWKRRDKERPSPSCSELPEAPAPLGLSLVEKDFLSISHSPFIFVDFESLPSPTTLPHPLPSPPKGTNFLDSRALPKQSFCALGTASRNYLLLRPIGEAGAWFCADAELWGG